MRSKSRSSAEIPGLLPFQEKQTSIKEQAPSSLAAKNWSYNDHVWWVRSFLPNFSSFKVKQSTAGGRPGVECFIWVYKGKL